MANTDAAISANASPVDVPPTQLAISSAVPAATHEAAAQVLAAPAIAEQAADANAPKPTIVTAAMPPQLLPGSYALPSLLAHIASDKFCDGLPLHRQEDRFARLGATIHRSTMARWLEEVGAIMGATLVEAMREEALATAFCIATDATGVLVQPDPRPDKKRQPCRRAHFFVQIADADHVFFEYTPVETSKVVSELFRGFSGFIQADAKSVYDVTLGYDLGLAIVSGPPAPDNPGTIAGAVNRDGSAHVYRTCADVSPALRDCMDFPDFTPSAAKR